MTRFKWSLQMLATPKGLSDEKATRMMAALRDGQTLRLFCVTAPRLDAYFAAHPVYAREARPLIEANAKAALLRKGARLRDLTHCIYGHPFSGANISIGPTGRRKCLTCAKRRDLAPRPPTQVQIEKVTAALNAGKTLRLICHGLDGNNVRHPQIVSFRKLNLYRRLNPAFDSFIVSSTAQNHSRALQRRFHPNAVKMEIAREQNNDYHEIRAMLPANFPDRDDVVSDIFEALLNGSLQRDQVKSRVRDFVRIHNREFSTAYPKFGGHILHSLDAPLFEDGATTRGDTISRGLWD
jgi:hypothetical protein